MALKPTIYKARIHISDLNIDFYDSLSLTIAQHPSETIERMMARLMAFCLEAKLQPSLTKGLSEVDEPDLWVKDYDETIQLWVDIGEPAVDRVKKSCRSAKQVSIYSFNSKSDTWFKQHQTKLQAFPAKIIQFNPQQIVELGTLVERTMDWSVTITGESAYISSPKGEVELNWKVLQEG